MKIINITFVFLFIFLFHGFIYADTIKSNNTIPKIDTSGYNKGMLQIDTGSTIVKSDSNLQTNIQIPDTAGIESIKEKTLTNTKLFIYILLSVGGLGLFFYIFVMTLFRTFHKTRSTRQSTLLSWNLFFIVSVIWLFIIWGLAADFISSSSFMVTMIFLFIISLITTLIAIKSK
jgi:membrane-associated HD superfamily phosphohydrolase